MRFIGDVLLDLAVLIDEFDGAICESDSCDLTGTSAEGHPVVIDGVGVEVEPFARLSGVDIPFIDDIVIADAEWEARYLVSSLKEHQLTDVHMSSCLAWDWRGLILNLIKDNLNYV